MGKRGKKNKQQQKAARSQPPVTNQFIVIQTSGGGAISTLLIIAAFATIVQLLAGDNLIGGFTQKPPTEIAQVREKESILNSESPSIQVQVTSPANNSTFTVGSNVTLTARASSSYGKITHVTFSANGQALSSSSTPLL